ncbi:STAS domain-containing protein [Streptomyces formicae]|uniref:STAS domain-containing protein n=1 Tax=Streptomyces formicae TaxID=1616117 RepID=A0ABY3WCP7_9ACTN|nr:STAS domain-containing protein [Streptomyces formicae]UNM10309.1 STAS domain-containing protein [Streptomyces formicae]
MPIPQLTVFRHDMNNRALMTLTGEIDLETVHVVRESLAQCLRDGIRTIDVDLTTVTFCDVTGLNAFLHASSATAAACGSLRLHHPPPILARILALTGTSTLLLALPDGRSGRAADAPAHRIVPATTAPPVGAL